MGDQTVITGLSVIVWSIIPNELNQWYCTSPKENKKNKKKGKKKRKRSDVGEPGRGGGSARAGGEKPPKKLKGMKAASRAWKLTS